MVDEGLISKEEAVTRIDPAQLDQLLHPMLDPSADYEVAAKGLNASPGAASGKIVLDADTAARLGESEPVILVGWETSPDDIHGMIAAQGILTAHGGMTSHAAVVARGMGKPCVAGCEELAIDSKKRRVRIGRHDLAEGEYLPDIMHKFAVDFIDRHKEDKFFLYYPMSHIHGPIVRTPDSKKGEDKDQLYADNVEYMDKLVGQLMKELDRQHLREERLRRQSGFERDHTIQKPRLVAKFHGFGFIKAGYCEDSPSFAEAFYRFPEAGRPVPNVRSEGEIDQLRHGYHQDETAYLMGVAGLGTLVTFNAFPAPIVSNCHES